MRASSFGMAFATKRRQAQNAPAASGKIIGNAMGCPNTLPQRIQAPPQAATKAMPGATRNTTPSASARISHQAVLKMPTPNTKDCTPTETAITTSNTTIFHVAIAAKHTTLTLTSPRHIRSVGAT